MSATTAGYKQWEYLAKDVPIDGFTAGALNKYGKDGWEVICCKRYKHANHWDRLYVVMKREKCLQDTPQSC